MKFRVSDSAIDFRDLAEVGSTTAHGAEVFFIGKVRETNLGRIVTSVSYDAFAPLAERVFETICIEAQKRWGSLLRFKVLHRTGNLEVGEVCILIAVSSPHRAEAYRASRYVIEQIKVRAPIWKKEHYIDGESDWLQGHALCSHSHNDDGDDNDDAGDDKMEDRGHAH